MSRRRSVAANVVLLTLRSLAAGSAVMVRVQAVGVAAGDGVGDAGRGEVGTVAATAVTVVVAAAMVDKARRVARRAVPATTPATAARAASARAASRAAGAAA